MNLRNFLVREENLRFFFVSIDRFLAAFQREKGVWIIKPVASSQGKGIFLINHVKYFTEIIPKERNVFCSLIKFHWMKISLSVDTLTIPF